MTSGPRDRTVEDPDLRSPPSWDFIRILTLAMLAIVAVVVAFLGYYLVTYVKEQRQLSECYRSAFNETNSALATTISAAGRDRRGLLALLTSLTDPAQTREQRSAELEAYKQLLAMGEVERASNPLPNRTC